MEVEILSSLVERNKDKLKAERTFVEGVREVKGGTRDTMPEQQNEAKEKGWEKIREAEWH